MEHSAGDLDSSAKTECSCLSKMGNGAFSCRVECCRSLLNRIGNVVLSKTRFEFDAK